MAEIKGLSPEQIDVLGEIANISMGSSATSLSQMLSQEVSITTPNVLVKGFEELFGSFTVPYIAIRVNFTSGIQGFNLLVIKVADAKIMVRMLMGNRVTDGIEFNEIEMSALSEIMNQMMGGSATALNQVYKSPIAISPPHIQLVDLTSSPEARPELDVDEPLVTVSFRFQIGEVIDSEVFQVIPLSSAIQQAQLMLGKVQPSEVPPTKAKPANAVVEKADFPLIEKNQGSSPPRNIEMLMDIPLDASVVLGSITKTVQQVLSLSEGSIVELDKLVEEPVYLYVNGVPVARGEIVVINENFGLRITEIISSSKRLESITSIKKI